MPDLKYRSDDSKFGKPLLNFVLSRFTKSDHEALVDIFKKIGQKELTKVVQIKEICSLRILFYFDDLPRWDYRSYSPSSRRTLMLTLSPS